MKVVTSGGPLLVFSEAVIAILWSFCFVSFWLVIKSLGFEVIISSAKKKLIN